MLKLIITKLLGRKRETFAEDLCTKESVPTQMYNYYFNSIVPNLDTSYADTRDLFKVSMQNRKLNKQQIQDLLKYIDYELRDLEKYKQYKFENEAHEIYVKLKNNKLNSEAYKRIQTKINSK